MDNDDDLDSSPALPAPQLHSEIFGTPAARGRKTVPGVSVLTPARKKGTGGGKQAAGDMDARGRGKGIWDSDSDNDDDDGEDGEGGMSPPKTMQFHVPQSRLLRTPGMLFFLPPRNPFLFLFLLIPGREGVTDGVG